MVDDIKLIKLNHEEFKITDYQKKELHVIIVSDFYITL